MYERVIVPLDGSDAARRALAPGLRLAVASDAPLVVIGVTAGAVQIPALQRTLERQATDAVDLEAASVATSVVVKHQGEPWRAIVEEVDDRPGSLVCMASRGRAKTAVLFGSTGEAVLRAVTAPVLLVGPAADGRGFRLEHPLLVCVDGSIASETILPIVAGWSIVFRVPLTVVTVATRTASGPDGSSDGDESSYVRSVAEKLSADTGHRAAFDVLHGGNVAESIAAYARARDVCAIAAATHGRTGLRRVTAGSVTAALVRHAPQPVLTYRPLDLLR